MWKNFWAPRVQLPVEFSVCLFFFLAIHTAWETQHKRFLLKEKGFLWRRLEKLCQNCSFMALDLCEHAARPARVPSPALSLFRCVLFFQLSLFCSIFAAFEDNLETRIFDSFRNFHAIAAAAAEAAGTPLMPLLLPLLPHFVS